MINPVIQIGIDLGTTNSEVAININGDVEIVKNVYGDEYTPSVFGIDKAKNTIVGKRAYERLYKDSSEEEIKNNKAEVKRLMGTAEKTYFSRINKEMSSEEISAEILKSLKEDVLRKHPDFNSAAAVITVPAAFSVLQAEATKRAGNLAGFEYVVLLQEPIAAAVSYGFGEIKNKKWLIYDLGGGTFDVALISSNEGILSVLSHNGDNFLGGKNIDYEIVDKILVPKINEKFKLTGFSRDNKQYQSIFAKLKYIAETSKIYLSQYTKSTVEIDGIGKDENGNEMYLSFPFSRANLDELLKPFVDRTIALTKQTIKEAGISKASIEKIIFIGGPTQIPYIKTRLESDIGISVDCSVDPLTAVARGASIYAISKAIPKEFTPHKKVKKDILLLEINHENLTSESEETVSGIIKSLRESEDEYYIQIQSDSGSYSGSKIKLKNGKFIDTVTVERNKTNLYWLYLFDKKGNSIKLEPDSFSITHGLSIAGTPLPHSIGIVLAKKGINNSFDFSNVREKIFEKGTILPVKHSDTYRTIRKLKKIEKDNPLQILVDEGESDIPDRNTFVCSLGINGKDLPHDLPEGTEVEITVDLNESRELFVTVYIPLIDLHIDGRSTIMDESINVKDLELEISIQAEKAKRIIDNCSSDEKDDIEIAISSTQASVKNARTDEDEKRKASKQIKELKAKLDVLESEKALPMLEKELKVSMEKAENIINEFSSEQEQAINKEQLSKIKVEGQKAIKDKDKILLSRINEQIQELIAKVVFSNPATWLYHFNKLVTEKHVFTNEKDANYFKTKGLEAVERGDFDELRRCVQNLMSLLPTEEQNSVRLTISGITK